MRKIGDNMKRRFIKYPIHASSDAWSTLSSSDQTAVEYAVSIHDSGRDWEYAIDEGVRRVNEGNAEPEYEDEDFYLEEADEDKVREYLKRKYHF